MRKFETAVMSEVEPSSQGTLWIKPKRSTLDKNGPSQFDIWYFGESGWRPLADYDTRYNFSPSYSTASSKESLVVTSEADSENGIVTNDLTFSVYDGSRDIQNSNNFTLESGLKKEIDKLRSYIESEVSRLDGRITSLSNAIDTLSRTVSNNTDRIAQVEGRLSLLES